MSINALIRVVGFSHIERHALNSLLRISQQRSPSYDLWTVAADKDPHIILVDAEHADADFFVCQHRTDSHLKLIWVGAEPHIFAWRNIARPIVWAKVLSNLDDALSMLHQVESSDYSLSQPLLFQATGPGAYPEILDRKRVLVVDDDLTARQHRRRSHADGALFSLRCCVARHQYARHRRLCRVPQHQTPQEKSAFQLVQPHTQSSDD